MAYNSSNNINSLKTVCGIGLVGLETSFKGPAPGPSPDKPDIVEEAINFYRVNIIMRNFPVRGKELDSCGWLQALGRILIC
jgi:actin related protein 2/3 complex subunit 3